MARIITDKLTRKRRAKAACDDRSAVIIGSGCIAWHGSNGAGAGQNIEDWLDSSPTGDWYMLDMHLHSASLDVALTSRGALLRHFEAGATVIAINAYTAESPLESTGKKRVEADLRIINASYLLSSKPMSDWQAIAGASTGDDCQDLISIINAIDDVVFAGFGARLAMTIPSTAMEAWKRHIPKGEVYSRQHSDVEILARDAFFGGWNYIRNTDKHLEGVYYDANSLYAYVMRRYGVPSGRASAVSEYVSGDIGIYNVRVSGLYPGMINPVSVRVGFEVAHPVCDDESDGFQTSMTSVDIESCRRQGITISVIDGYRWKAMCYPFGEFVDKCETLRAENDRGSALNAMAKLLQASLFGKFGAQSFNKEVFVTQSDLSSHGFTLAEGLCGFSEDGETGINRWIRDTESTTGTIQPHWAAFITAHARAYMLSAVDIAGFENLLYAATDSLILTSEGSARLEASAYCQNPEEYGKFKTVHKFLEFRAFAQNRYAGSAVTSDGEYYVFGASSGIPESEQMDYDKLYSAWLSDDVASDDAAMRTAGAVFTLGKHASIREKRLAEMRAKRLKAQMAQTRTEMFGTNPDRDIKRW